MGNSQTCGPKEDLLSQLDSLRHSERMKATGLFGKNNADSPDFLPLVDEFLAGNVYEQSLALAACIHARKDEKILQCLRGNSTLIRKYACNSASYLSDESIEALVLESPPATRKQLIQGIVRRGQTELAEKLLPQLRANFGPKIACMLIPVCTEVTIAKVLAEDSQDVECWGLLAYKFPQIMLDHIRRELETSSPQSHDGYWGHYNKHMKQLTRNLPDEVEKLASDFPIQGAWPINLLVLNELIKLRTELAVKWLDHSQFRSSAERNNWPAQVQRKWRKFNEEQQVRMLKVIRKNQYHVRDCLNKFPPAMRSKRFHAIYEDFDPVKMQWQWSDSIMDMLPQSEAKILAQHNNSLRSVQEGHVSYILQNMTYYDLEEARARYAEEAKASVVDDRITAIRNYILNTSHNERGMTEMFEWIKRVKNEQDPVRQSTWSALSQIKPKLLEMEHFPHIQELIDFTVEARDNSGNYNITYFLTQMIRYWSRQPDTEIFKELFKFLGQLGQNFSVYNMHWEVGKEQMQVEQLIPLFEEYKETETKEALLSIAEYLGKRGWKIPQLEANLEDCVRLVNSKEIRRRAINTMMRPRPKRDQYVKMLLDQDKSAITISPIFEHLHKKRQDMLDPYLTSQLIDGDFYMQNDKQIFVQPVKSGFHRWLPRQQESFSRVLISQVQKLAEKPYIDKASQMNHIERLPLMKVNNLATFEGWIAGEDVTLAESALKAISYLDDANLVLPTLLANLDGDRAKVAMYQLQKVFSQVLASTMNSAIDDLFAREKLKITVRKETIRLLGMIQTPRSLEILKQQLARPKLHKDIKIAIGHSARSMLHIEEAWDILEEIGKSDDKYVTMSLFSQNKALIAPTQRPRYVKLILKGLAHEDNEVRSQAVSALNQWIDGNEEAVAEACFDRLKVMENCPEWGQAKNVLVSCCRDGKCTEMLVQIVCYWMSIEVTEATNAQRDFDLPAYQRLQLFINGLSSERQKIRFNKLRDCFNTLIEILKHDAKLWKLTNTLKFSLLNFEEAEELSNELFEIATDCPDSPLFVEWILTDVRNWSRRFERSTENIGYLTVIQNLMDRNNTICSLIAVELLKETGPKNNWSEDCCVKLRALRASENISIRIAANDLWIRNE